MSKEAISKTPERRVRRTPLGQRNVLSVSGKEPGYEYRFVNDTADRVAQFQDAGWEIVPAAGVRIGDKRVGNPTPEGTQAQASVGGGDKAYLMRIRDDWYKEDQARKQEYVNATEAATKQEALDGTYGKLEISRD
jgi:hypothetical protein